MTQQDLETHINLNVSHRWFDIIGTSVSTVIQSHKNDMKCEENIKGLALQAKVRGHFITFLRKNIKQLDTWINPDKAWLEFMETDNADVQQWKIEQGQ